MDAPNFFCFFFDGFAEEIQFDFIFLVNCLLGWIKIPLILPNELYACYNPSERDSADMVKTWTKKAKWFHQFDIVQRTSRDHGWLSFFEKIKSCLIKTWLFCLQNF